MPGMGGIARDPCRIAARKPDTCARAAGPSKSTVAQHGLRRMTGRAQCLDIRWVEVRATATAGDDVIDMRGGDAAANYFTDRTQTQNRGPEASPRRALIEWIGWHQRYPVCATKWEMFRKPVEPRRLGRSSQRYRNHTRCEFRCATRHFCAELRFTSLASRNY